MAASTREQMLLETLTVVADTLIDDFDVVEFLHELAERCAAICEAVDVGIVLVNDRPELVVMASTSERLHAIEALQLSAGHGPCLDAFVTGEVVTASSREEIARRWPALAEGVRDTGYQSVHAVPLRLRRTTVGSLNFFRDREGRLELDDVIAAQTIADVATIGLVQERAIREAATARDQLQHALDSRVVIEQAKGVIAHRNGVDMETAWRMLRQRARSRQARVGDIARAVVDGVIIL
jgi:AmiR/NasT family two-component response regulator